MEISFLTAGFYPVIFNLSVLLTGNGNGVEHSTSSLVNKCFREITDLLPAIAKPAMKLMKLLL